MTRRYYLWLLAIQQLTGAFFGLIIIANNNHSTYDTLFLSFLILLSLMSGILLLSKRNRIGITLSIVNFFCQVVSFNFSDGINFGYECGLFCSFKLFPPTFDLNFDFGVGTTYYLMSDISSPDFIGVNIFAIMAIYILISGDEDLPYLDKSDQIFDAD